MRAALLALLAVILSFSCARAQSVAAICPPKWTFGTETKYLERANVWAEYQIVDDEFGDTEEIPGRSVVHIDMAKVDRRPLFLFCRYQKTWGAELAVSIPEGVTTCAIQWKAAKWDAEEKVNHKYVRALRAECRGSVQGEPSRVFPAEAPSLTSDIQGLRLRRPAEELRQEVLARGGTWAQLGEGMPAEITLGDSKLRVVFSLTTRLSRKIVLYGPHWPPRDPAFYAAIIQRFGFPDYPFVAKCTNAWNVIRENDEVQVEWYRPCDKDASSAPQEMRLVDMADPHSKKERK